MRLQFSHFYLTLGLLLMVPKTSVAQEIWSLGACIDYAKEHNLDIQKGRNGLLLAEVDEQQSELAFLPSLNLGRPNTLSCNIHDYWNSHSIKGRIV